MRRAAPYAGLWIVALLVSAFTLRRYLDAFDEGLMLQAASRIADGQWPYRDFKWPYGPGQPLLLGLEFRLLEPSVWGWRILRSLTDATVAVLVFALVRPGAGERWGLAAGLVAAVTMAQPTTANPFGLAFAFGLAAVLAAARGRPALGGVLVALAAIWRPEFGVFAGAAVLVIAPRAAFWAVGATLAAYAPFAVAAGVPDLWEELVGGSAQDGAYWRLPFPFAFAGSLRSAEGLKDAVGFYVPLVAIVGLAVAVVAGALRRTWSRELAGLSVLGLGGLAYFLSRSDDLHQQPLVVAAAGALALAAPRRIAVVVLGFLLLAGVANRVSALVLPPRLDAVAGVPGANGIRVPPAEAAALPRLRADVQRRVPPGEPIYVAPRRSDLVRISNPLVHTLVRRPNVVGEDVVLQARPAEQARIVAALRRARPRAVVRWTDPASSRAEPNERGRPSGSRALDAYLARTYREAAAFGAYRVLVPRG